MNMVTKPHHQIPWNRPDSLQLDASLGRIKDLKICQINQSLQENIAYIQDQLASWQFDSALLQEFFCFNDLLDRSRKVKLANFIPDLDLLRYHAGQPRT